MARQLCFSCWLLVCWVVVTVAEGQKAVATPLRGSGDNGGPTDCEIITLTPPPPTVRNPVTRIQLLPRTPKCPFHSFPRQGPRVHIRFPNRPFLPRKCHRRFQIRPFFWPRGHLSPRYRHFPRRKLWRGSSSEESREKREAPNMLMQKRPMALKRD